MIYIILAGMWLLIAVVFFIMAWRDPASLYARIPGLGIPIWWLAVSLVVYNLVRFVAWRQRKKRRTDGPRNPLLGRQGDDEPSPCE